MPIDMLDGWQLPVDDNTCNVGNGVGSFHWVTRYVGHYLHSLLYILKLNVFSKSGIKSCLYSHTN